MDRLLSTIKTPTSGDFPLLLGSTVVAGLLVAELFTPADPIRRCYRFWKQLGVHVRMRAVVRYACCCIDSHKCHFRRKS